jgi:hypothetical protein
MPNPTAPPTQRARNLPRDLDRKLEQALRKGDMGGAQQVLAELGQRPTLEEVPTPNAVLPFAKKPIEMLPPVGEPEPEPEDPMDTLQAAMDGVREHLRSDPAQARAHLEALRDTASDLLRDLPEHAAPREPEEPAEPEGPPPLRLPPFRKQWMLLIDPPGVPDAAQQMARSLRLDAATCRLHARASFPRACLRSDDRGDLALRAERYSLDLGRPAKVLSRDDLLDLDPAMTVHRTVFQQDWRASGGHTWLQDSETASRADQTAVSWPHDALLFVVGEVQIRTYRPGATNSRMLRKRDTGLQASGERRIGVVDVHTPSRILRVTTEHTDLAGWPGVTGRGPLAMRGWLDGVPTHWPNARLLGKRVCPPEERPSTLGEDGVTEAQATGWPVFEEHSRAARLLFLG